MAEMKIYVPTYYGDLGTDSRKREFDEPRIPVVIRPADGVRIVLGSHDFWSEGAPDIQVERRRNGWVVFIHPMNGGDASGYVCMVDDGRSFVVAENAHGPVPPIAECRWEDAIAAVDGVKMAEPTPPPDSEHDPRGIETCELCRKRLTESGDNWDGLCPECADAVSNYLDDNGLENEDREVAIDAIRKRDGHPPPPEAD